MLKAVHDTNIIVSAVLHKDRFPASLLSLALEGKVRLFVSEELLRQYEGVLKRPNFKLDGKEIEDLMRLVKRKDKAEQKYISILKEMDGNKRVKIGAELYFRRIIPVWLDYR